MNIRDQQKLLEYNSTLMKRKVVLKLLQPDLLHLVSDYQLKSSLENKFGSVEMVYCIKDGI